MSGKKRSQVVKIPKVSFSQFLQQVLESSLSFELAVTVNSHGGGRREEKSDLEVKDDEGSRSKVLAEGRTLSPQALLPFVWQVDLKKPGGGNESAQVLVAKTRKRNVLGNRYKEKENCVQLLANALLKLLTCTSPALLTCTSPNPNPYEIL